VPKVVDHEAQRVKFSEAAMSLIAKDELLMHIVRHTSDLQTRRVNEFTSEYSGLKALEHLLCDDAIITESTREDWMVWVTFLYKAALHETFAAMHAELIEGWLGRIRRLLRDAQEAGEIGDAIDVDFEAKAIWAYSAGIGQLSLLHSGLLPVDVQKELISAYLGKLRATSS
jgi:hypothetical protein